MKLQFLGAAGTVTGSKYLLADANHRVLIDCGLFQGLKNLRLRNWAALPVAAESIGAVVLTHAHLDHSGYLPLLVKQGFRGPIQCTPATAELCKLLLPDSGHIQEEDADYANRAGFSRHHPALPLYTEQDALRCLRQLQPVEFNRAFEIGPRLQGTFTPAGHILGAACLSIAGTAGRLVFSGDLGRPRDPIMRAPAPIADADYLVVESTYGDRAHATADPLDELADTITRTIKRGGAVIVPAFAVGRTQTLLHLIQRLKSQDRIPPQLPVYLNSPMATDATGLYERFAGELRLPASDCAAMCRTATFVNSVEQSKRINALRKPMIVIAASGMATGGRVIHHLKAFAPDPRNTILFSGYQAAGTRGAAMLGGAREIRIHGQEIPVRAEVAALSTLSAHADANEILHWLGGFRRPPRAVFVTHGEPVAADTLRQRIDHGLLWNVSVPEHAQVFDLGA
ncbi:MAG: MBL fold metallo-hydrolase [Proteobacteria bacterium]|nr:MBL fold metallo-hydrolase [Pseudomonadota bacterium]